MYSQMPKEVLGYWCDGGFLQFQVFEQVEKDTIVILKFDRNNRFEFYKGISVDKDYERFVDMKIIEYNQQSFFTARACNSGNAKGNKLYVFYIDEKYCTLHHVEISEAFKLYSQTLSENLFIWDDEIINCNDNSITSEFYIWKKTDIHSIPTEGKVSVVYNIEQTGKRNYKLYPKEMNFTKGTFEVN